MKTILLVMVFFASVMNATAQKQQVKKEINVSAHLTGQAHVFSKYRASSGVDKDTLPIGSTLHIQTLYDSTPHIVKFWISTKDGSIIHELSWQGNVSVMKSNTILEDGQKIEAFAVRWNDNLVLSTYKKGDESFEVNFDEDESDRKTSSKDFDMSRNFSINGAVNTLFLTPDGSSAGTIHYPEGWLWHLENTMIGGECYAIFYIIAPDGSKHHYSYWNGGITIDAMRMAGGTMHYYVQDSDFTHLMILGKIIRLCTVPR